MFVGLLALLVASVILILCVLSGVLAARDRPARHG
jgi:hypothetical protein